MRLIVISSSSAGNCYILENNQEALLIECGVKINKIKQALGFKMSKVVACLVTHEHKDHCIAIKDVIASGIRVCTSAGTAKACGIDSSHRYMQIEKQKKFKVGGFTVLPFDVKHDAMEPMGFIIHHDETGKVLFLTDTYYVPYTFKGLNNIIVEANYSQEIIDQKVRDGASPEFLRNRVLQSHMSLDTCKQLLKANDLSQVNNIVLIHLSDSNSNAEQFKREIESCSGKNVHVADAGVVIENFKKSPF